MSESDPLILGAVTHLPENVRASQGGEIWLFPQRNNRPEKAEAGVGVNEKSIIRLFGTLRVML